MAGAFFVLGEGLRAANLCDPHADSPARRQAGCAGNASLPDARPCPAPDVAAHAGPCPIASGATQMPLPARAAAQQPPMALQCGMLSMFCRIESIGNDSCRLRALLTSFPGGAVSVSPGRVKRMHSLTGVAYRKPLPIDPILQRGAICAHRAGEPPACAGVVRLSCPSRANRPPARARPTSLCATRPPARAPTPPGCAHVTTPHLPAARTRRQAASGNAPPQQTRP